MDDTDLISDAEAHELGRKNKCRKDRKKKEPEPNDDGEASAKAKSAQPHQIKFYSGITLDILRLALIFMRLHLLTENGYPTSAEQFKLAKRFFKVANQTIFGSKYKGECIYLTFWPSDDFCYRSDAHLHGRDVKIGMGNSFRSFAYYSQFDFRSYEMRPGQSGTGSRELLSPLSTRIMDYTHRKKSTWEAN